MGSPSSQRSHRRRRMMSEINVVPYIDVTLVLLIIFMVTAPMIVTGSIDLPRVGQASQTPVAAIDVTIRQDGSITVKRNVEGDKEVPVIRDELVRAIQALNTAQDAPIIISAEKAVRYEHVIATLDTLQRAGFSRVGLNVRKD